MKTPMIALMTLAVAGAGLPQASAGDREWATAGKILTGVVAASVLAKALEPAPCVTTTYYPVTTVVSAPPVSVQPAPVYVQPTPVVVPAPPPVLVRPAPVYVQTVPVMVAPTTAWVQPAPVLVASPPVVTYSYRVVHHRPRHWRPHRLLCW